YGSFFFSSRRRHTRFSRDWSSDVCSSDLCGAAVKVTRCSCSLGGAFQARAVRLRLAGVRRMTLGPFTFAPVAPYTVPVRESGASLPPDGPADKVKVFNADDQPAGPQGPHLAEGQEQGSGDGAEPAEARRLHSRLYYDPEEAELGAAQGR